MSDEEQKAPERRKKVLVSCSIVNGIELEHFDRGEDDGTGSGYHPIIAKGPRVKLAGPSGLSAGVGRAGKGDAVTTTVDAEWFDAWWKANQRNPLVANGAIALLGDAPDEE